jgi:hypothetical protein
MKSKSLLKIALSVVLLFGLIALLTIVGTVEPTSWPHQMEAVTAVALTAAVTPRSAFTIQEFCGRNAISKGLYYKLDKLGLGPDYFLVGVKEQHRRISLEAERRWQAQREADALARREAKAAKQQSAEQSAAEAG